MKRVVRRISNKTASQKRRNCNTIIRALTIAANLATIWAAVSAPIAQSTIIATAMHLARL